jgi:hypothetical protein
MKPDELPDLSPIGLFMSDPILLIGSLLPFVLLSCVLFFRWRAWRRLNAVVARNERRSDQTREQSDAQWRDAAARSERMIALLTEIRDQLARIVPAERPNGADGPEPGSAG